MALLADEGDRPNAENPTYQPPTRNPRMNATVTSWAYSVMAAHHMAYTAGYSMSKPGRIGEFVITKRQMRVGAGTPTLSSCGTSYS